MSAPSSGEALVSGIGIVSPIGVGVDAFWQALLEKRSGIRRFEDGRQQLSTMDFGGYLVDFDPKEYVRPRKALKVMCREIQVAFSAATLAMQAANLEATSMPSDRIGTVFGSEMMSGQPEELIDTLVECGIRSGQPAVAEFGEAAMRKVYPLWMLKYLPNMATCHVGIALGAHGPNNTIVAGDVSAIAAMDESLSVVGRGHADCVITGASGTRISPTRIAYWRSQSVPKRCDPVSDSSRPFALGRSGVVCAEAATAMVIESARSVAKRKIKPLAKLKGTANCFIAPREPQQGPQLAIEQAIRCLLARHQMDQQDIGAVISHGMGDPIQDRAEARAVAAAIGHDVAVVAPMAAVGHAGAASAAITLVTAALVANHRIVPPTLHADAVDPECPVRLLQRPEGLAGKYVLALSHTRQGHACVAAFESCAGVPASAGRAQS